MRTEARPLTGTPPVDPPPVDTVDGHRVVWQVWLPYGFPARLRAVCDSCGYDGTQWIAYGVVDPQPGEMFTDVRAGAKSVWEVEVPAWPVLRLVAHQCPLCHARRVYDNKGGGWTRVPLATGSEQLELFPTPPANLPAQRRPR